MRILSGIRPTGHPHLGNYFGALKQWVDLTKQASETYFCIVDQHALTTLSEREALLENTLIMAATYIACGIDPQKNAIFAQSHVPYHTELAWYLMCLTPMGWLSRMTQFKDKASKNKDSTLTGLFTYPVLMAADIVLYDATHVPVGEDQKQHVEFARDIVQVFNNSVQKQVLKIPEPLIQTSGERIKSLRDGLKKMSKSDISDYSRIHLNDSNDEIIQKLRKAKTDPDVIKAQGAENRPELDNLLTLYALTSDMTKAQALVLFEGKNFSELKTKLADALIEHITPIRSRVEELLTDKSYLLSCLAQGAEKARATASKTMTEVRKALNLLV